MQCTLEYTWFVVWGPFYNCLFMLGTQLFYGHVRYRVLVSMSMSMSMSLCLRVCECLLSTSMSLSHFFTCIKNRIRKPLTSASIFICMVENLMHIQSKFENAYYEICLPVFRFMNNSWQWFCIVSIFCTNFYNMTEWLREERIVCHRKERKR